MLIVPPGGSDLTADRWKIITVDEHDHGALMRVDQEATGMLLSPLLLLGLIFIQNDITYVLTLVNLR